MDAGERLSDTAVTVRGLCVGCVLALGIAIGAPYGRQVIQGTSLALTSATPAAFFLFFLLLLSLHLFLGWLAGSAASFHRTSGLWWLRPKRNHRSGESF